jgi:hypothetical protein
MNIWISWALAVGAVYVGYKNYGWQGILFALTIIVFWLLLQYSRINRIMTKAGASELGRVNDARSLNLRLRKNLPMLDVLKMTNSLGVKTSQSPETYRWWDANGDAVDVVFVQGRTSTWALERNG